MADYEPISGEVVLPVDENEYKKSGSQFVDKPGSYVSVMSMPGWKEKGRTMAFPLEITEDGPQEGKEGTIFVGFEKGIWKLKEILEACGVPYSIDKKTGNVKFNPAEVVGKEVKSIWQNEKDNRPVEEGGTGKVFVKLAGVAPVDAEEEEI